MFHNVAVLWNHSLIDGLLGYWFFIVIQNTSLNILIYIYLWVFGQLLLWDEITGQRPYAFSTFTVITKLPFKRMCLNLTVPPTGNDMFIFHQSYGWSILTGQQWFGFCNGLMGVWLCIPLFFSLQSTTLLCFAFVTQTHTHIYLLIQNKWF